jgi:hypothetical protein
MTGEGLISFASQSTNALPSASSLSDSRSGKVELPLVAVVEPVDVIPRPPLPELPYSLRSRKLSITIVWAVLLLDGLFLPLMLFYVLKCGVKLDDAKSTPRSIFPSSSHSSSYID